MNIIFLGAPGVGKGTYTGKLKILYGIPHISTGDIFRENIKNKTELGRDAEAHIEKGELVPDELTIGMVKNRLAEEDIQNGYILDGFPRTIPQAEALEKFAKIDVVVNFVAAESVIMQRLSGRRICRKCGEIYHIKNIPTQVEGYCDLCHSETYQRDDDKPEAIKERLKVYEKQTKPLIDYYKKKGLIVGIDANSEDIETIVATIRSKLDEFKQKPA